MPITIKNVANGTTTKNVYACALSFGIWWWSESHRNNRSLNLTIQTCLDKEQIKRSPGPYAILWEKEELKNKKLEPVKYSPLLIMIHESFLPNNEKKRSWEQDMLDSLSLDVGSRRRVLLIITCVHSHDTFPAHPTTHTSIRCADSLHGSSDIYNHGSIYRSYPEKNIQELLDIYSPYKV